MGSPKFWYCCVALLWCVVCGVWCSYPYGQVGYELNNLPAPWVAVPDPNSGRFYYWNQLTDEVTWQLPQQQQQQQQIASSTNPRSSMQQQSQLMQQQQVILS